MAMFEIFFFMPSWPNGQKRKSTPHLKYQNLEIDDYEKTSLTVKVKSSNKEKSAEYHPLDLW